MNTKMQTALVQLAEGTAITAILAGIVAVFSYLQSNTGQVNWKDVLVVFLVAFATSLAHSLTAYLKVPVDISLQGVITQQAVAQTAQNVATTAYTAVVDSTATKSSPVQAKPVVALPNAPGSVLPESIPQGVDEYKNATGEIPAVQA